MRKKLISHGEFISVILLVISTVASPVNAADEILLGSRRFTPDEGITATTKAKIDIIPEPATVALLAAGGLSIFGRAVRA